VCNRLVVGFLIVAATSLGTSSHASGIVATGYLTIGPDANFGNQIWPGTTTIIDPTNPQLPITLVLVEPPIVTTPTTDAGSVPASGSLIATNYDLKIYFGPFMTPDTGSQQSNPYVEITGNIAGTVSVGTSGSTQSGFALADMSIVLKNDTGASGVPESLLNLFSNPLNYQTWSSLDVANPADQRFTMTVQVGNETPEPATWLVFAVMIGGMAIRRRVKSQRSNGSRRVGQNELSSTPA
jgi:hypothetical protein